MLKSDIASEAIAALSAMSPPVALLSNTTFLAAPSRISVMLIPDCASCMMASDASVALTLSIGSMPRSAIKSPSGCASSIVMPMTDAMSAKPCSNDAALSTPTVIAAAIPPTAAMAAVAPAATAAPATDRSPRLRLTPSILPLALSSALIVIVRVSAAIIVSYSRAASVFWFRH